MTANRTIDNEAQEAKDIMDTLLHKLRSGELSSAAKRRSANSRRMSMAARREWRRTRSESVAMRAEDLLKHIQSEEESVPPLPPTSPTSPPPSNPTNSTSSNSSNSNNTRVRSRSRSGSRKLAASERMMRLASLAEEKSNEMPTSSSGADSEKNDNDTMDHENNTQI